MHDTLFSPKATPRRCSTRQCSWVRGSNNVSVNASVFQSEHKQSNNDYHTALALPPLTKSL
eukprot:m.489598 g.489598  ORF g.489598 m.489598 type:complete len:61 (+) comp21769_c0_seq11:500-682(+)